MSNRGTRQYDGCIELRAITLRSCGMGTDPRGLIGPRRRGSWDDADRAIRDAWPASNPHGAVIVWHWSLPNRIDYNDIVGEAWPVRGSRTEWWFRVLSPVTTPTPSASS